MSVRSSCTIRNSVVLAEGSKSYSQAASAMRDTTKWLVALVPGGGAVLVGLELVPNWAAARLDPGDAQTASWYIGGAGVAAVIMVALAVRVLRTDIAGWADLSDRIVDEDPSDPHSLRFQVDNSGIATLFGFEDVAAVAGALVEPRSPIPGWLGATIATQQQSGSRIPGWLASALNDAVATDKPVPGWLSETVARQRADGLAVPAWLTKAMGAAEGEAGDPSAAAASLVDYGDYRTTALSFRNFLIGTGVAVAVIAVCVTRAAEIVADASPAIDSPTNVVVHVSPDAILPDSCVAQDGRLAAVATSGTWAAATVFVTGDGCDGIRFVVTDDIGVVAPGE